MQIKQHRLGTINNQDIIQYQLCANNGFRVDILNYGAIIHGIWLPDKNGDLINTVLSYDNLESYINNPSYLGCIVGRHAGRIANAEFSLNGKTYQLEKNNGSANLHGGFGLHRRIWNTYLLNDGISLSYLSPDGEDGFPGQVNFTVNYRIKDNFILEIEYIAHPNMPTIINLTNHSYFNLSGGHDLAINQVLQINANGYCPINEETLPHEFIEDVTNTVFDFRNPKLISKDLFKADPQLKIGTGYDHIYFIENNAQIAAILKYPQNGISLEIKTDRPNIVLYTGNHLFNHGTVNSGLNCKTHLGICLETQNVPNAINMKSFNKNIYTPDNPYLSKNSWQFKVD